MSKLISILMPTRNPAEGFLKALRSIKSTASDFSQIEVLLRIDRDDIARFELALKLANEFNIKIVVGERGSGYVNMGQFIDELVAIATGKWCWLFDDDAWVEGKGWQEWIAAQPCSIHGPAINAQYYKLGHSIYPNGPKGGPVGLIVPTDFCKTLSHRNPVDEQWLSVIMARGWSIRQIPGITYCHDGRPR